MAQETCVDDNEDRRENCGRGRNYREWSESEKIRIVQIDMEVRLKGSSFMQRIKERWDGEYPYNEQIREEDKDLEYKFLAEFEKLEHCNFIEIEERDKLPKLKMQNQLIERANRVLGKYLKERSDIPAITDIVYAMGKAKAFTLGISEKERRSNKAKNGNRRERKI